jgi:tetratricopeptide (TPR) repeat protein
MVRRKARVVSKKLPILAGIAVGITGLFIFIFVHAQSGSSVSYAMRNFELGQYYFNADDNPNGPYDLEKAQRYFTVALSEDPRGNSLLWYQLGRIDFLNGRFVSAIYKFNKQIEYFGDSAPNVHYMLGLAYAYQAQISDDESDWQHAEDSFKTYLTLDPQSPWAHVDLSWVYFSEGKYEEMLPVLEEGLAKEPDQPWLLNMYGLALFNTGDAEGARDSLTRAKAAADKLTVGAWGSAYPGNDPKNWKEGLDSFREAIEKNLALAEGGK